jgi:hypothetical protein
MVGGGIDSEQAPLDRGKRIRHRVVDEPPDDARPPRWEVSQLLLRVPRHGAEQIRS